MKKIVLKASEINRQDIYSHFNNCDDVMYIGTNSGICTEGISEASVSFDDISLFIGVPESIIVDCSDEIMYQFFADNADVFSGIFYLRKNQNTSQIYDMTTKFSIGKGKILKDGNDITIIASGVMVKTALHAAEILEESCIHARVVDPVCIKPMDKALIYRCAVETGCMVTAENHNALGGLASAVEGILAERKPIPVLRVANFDRKNEVAEEYVLRASYALQETDIVAAALKALDMKNGRKTIQQYDTFIDYISKKKNIKSNLIWGDENKIRNPWISYVIPTFKRPELLKEAIESVLNQDPVDFDWQIIVSDNDVSADNSTEKLIRQINNERILYYRHEENLSAIGNWNRSIELARSPWVAMLHADDLLMHDHLKTMAKYIRKYEKKSKKPLAYISPQYIEFSDSNQVDINMDSPKFRYYEGMSEREKSIISDSEKLQLFTPFDAVITGASVFIPSNGTIMNREIMIKTGGFNGDYGVCTDVIKPLVLCEDYRVYKTLRPMGYYRFESNASMRPGMLHKIAIGCMKIADYSYNKNWMTRIWGNIAYDERFEEVIKIMLRYSKYGKNEVSREDFDDIHICREGSQRKWRQQIYKMVMKKYRKQTIYDMDMIYSEFFEDHMKETCNNLKSKKRQDQKLFLYGAGKYGKKALGYLSGIGCSVEGFVVSSGAEKYGKIDGQTVHNIAEANLNFPEAFYLVCTLPDKQNGIVRTLRKMGINQYEVIV